MELYKGQSRFGWETVLLGLALLSGASAQATAIEVVGWPLPRLDQAAPDMALGDDPVSGRQICPALTRLNLLHGRSEELIVRKVAEEFRDAKTGSLWRIELRTGIYWWNGAVVTSEDVAQFVRRVLPGLVASRGAGLWQLPDHDVKADGPSYVVVRWTAVPEFGPFILNDAPFYRPTSEGPMQYECAGTYRPEKQEFGLVLKPAPGYRSKALPEVRLYDASSRPSKAGDRLIELRSAAESPEPPKGKSSESHCRQSVELPFATMILWNTQEGPTADKEFRKLLTQLIPRGVLATSGAAELGQVAAAPVPRSHPGHNGSVKARPFDMRTVSEGLTRLGYKRKTAASQRVDAKGQPLTFVIQTQANSPGLIEKVLDDAFSAVGIGIKFTTAADGPLTGVLASFALDWPRVNFLGNFHSRVADTQPFWSPRDEQLDRLLEAYALSLTTAAPDFALLGKVQARLAELEPASVVLQHRACIVAGPAPMFAKGFSPTDPDWFRTLLF